MSNCTIFRQNSKVKTKISKVHLKEPSIKIELLYETNYQC